MSITKEQFAELGFQPDSDWKNTYERIIKTKQGDFKYQLGYVLETKSFNFDVYEPSNPMKSHVVFCGQEVYNFEELKYLLDRCVGYNYWLSQQD